MPVIIPKDLPAKELLAKEAIFTISEQRAKTQDIRPLKVAILNLMPSKEESELQLLRVLSNTPLQVEIDLIRPSSHQSKNVSDEHLNKFYKTFEEIKDLKYDGMIITGAPVEKLEYEEVNYWQELKEIMDYARTNVFSTMFICWASQGALYHYYGVQKHQFESKLSGVYPLEIVEQSPLVKGFDSEFFAPQSRYSYCKEEDIDNIKDLKIVARSDEPGTHIVTSLDHRLIFVSGHSEYEKDTLDKEYKRDLNKGLKPEIPVNYYKGDDPNNEIQLRWRASGNLMFANWLNYCVYQNTPYDISKISKKVVSKFGGSSLANSIQFEKVKNIIDSQERNFVVVSAPGKETEKDIKITDLLLDCYKSQNSQKEIRLLIQNLIKDQIELEEKSNEKLKVIANRFGEIAKEIQVESKIGNIINKVILEIKESTDKDFIVSRGEYLNAIIMSNYLGYKFVDAKDLIFFNQNGEFDENKSFEQIRRLIDLDEKVVIPGFYGSDGDGKIKTFQRGGSDITGSIIARAIGADLYENWTDVNGIMTDDPKVNQDAVTISNLNYAQLLSITQNGAVVYHPEAVEPVAKANIPINIRNTNNPKEPGTLVRDEI